MRLTLNVCGNCKDSSFASDFLMGARLTTINGDNIELCNKCVSHLHIRYNMYELRPEFLRASIPNGEYENERNSSRDHRPSADSRFGESGSSRATGELPAVPEK